MTIWFFATPIGIILILIVIIIFALFKLNNALKKIVPKTSFNIVGESSDDLSDNYLIDFREDRFSGNWNVTRAIINSTDEGNEGENVPRKPIRIAVKPIDVIAELQKPPTNWSLEGIEDRIGILKDKEDIITQRYAKQEVKALIECLENRKKYDEKGKDGITFREYFSQFDVTDGEKIESVTDKYDLQMGDADIFIPEFPDDATKIMKKYREKVQEICNKKPRFYVIAQKKDFKKAQSQRDPILLAQSPFGFYYFILGAWDKEMLYLPEL
jgi:hypothetical protein